MPHLHRWRGNSDLVFTLHPHIIRWLCQRRHVISPTSRRRVHKACSHEPARYWLVSLSTGGQQEGQGHATHHRYRHCKANDKSLNSENWKQLQGLTEIVWQRWGEKRKTKKHENVNSGDIETLAPFLLTVRRYHRLTETGERKTENRRRRRQTKQIISGTTPDKNVEYILSHFSTPAWKLSSNTRVCVLFFPPHFGALKPGTEVRLTLNWRAEKKLYLLQTVPVELTERAGCVRAKRKET